MNPISALFKVFYLPLCRAYAAHLGDRPSDNVFRLLCSLPFFRAHHYWPKFTKPKSFSEKIWHRMLYNRDPRLTLVSDKWRVRDYVASKVGSNYLIPLLWHGDRPEDIPFDRLPRQFVIKTNHGCGYNIVVQDKAQLDISKITKQLRIWLDENFCQDKYLGTEWAYKNIKPYIIIETFIGTSKEAPIDYKFFCYSGYARFVQVNIDRFGNASEKFLERDFKAIDVWNGVKQYAGKIYRPTDYEEMVQLADSLSRDFDFIRVDLYNVGGQAYVGELTCYHSGGLTPFVPRAYDYVFGEKWKIAPHQ